jgi:hypothetical protein
MPSEGRHFLSWRIKMSPCRSKWEQVLGMLNEELNQLPYRPGFKKHLMFQDVTAKYCIYDKVPSLSMSFFIRIKGCVNCCTTTSVHKKRVFTRWII